MDKDDLELLTLLPLTSRERITGTYQLHLNGVTVKERSVAARDELPLPPSMPNF